MPPTLSLLFHFLFLLFPISHSSPVTRRSADLASLLGLSTMTTDLSTHTPRHPEKYFHESIFHEHYDGRFSFAPLPAPTRLLHMRLLLASYTHTAVRAHVRTWIAHGSLLGWWWNGRLMPWDSDLDVHVDEAGMRELGGWWNMTVHSFSAGELGLVGGEETPFSSSSSSSSNDDDNGDDSIEIKTPRIPRPTGFPKGEWTALLASGKKYLLEVNPRFTNTSTRDRHNVIDARWIDVATGLFIDITTVHHVPLAPASRSFFSRSSSAAAAAAAADDDDGFAFSAADDDDGTHNAHMYTKDTHLYPRAALFPLRESTLEGVPVRVPYAYEALLRDEYGPLALTATWYRGYAFKKGADGDGAEWVEAPPEG